MLRVTLTTLPLIFIVLLCHCACAQDQHLARLSNAASIAEIKALQAPVNGSFSFIVIGDNRSGDEAFKRVITSIDKYVDAHTGTGKPLFVLHAGDIVPSGTMKQWRNYAQLRSKLNLPVVHVEGNHEIVVPTGAGNYEDLVGAKQWVFDFGGCRFIGLDNAGGRFSQKDIDFLRSKLGLDASGKQVGAVPPHTFVVFHRPPKYGRWKVHAMSSDGDGGRGGEMMKAVKQAKVTAVLMGHIHLYDEMKIDGISYIISAGAGSPLYPQYGFGKPEYGFLVVHVKPAAVDWDWVKVD